jgi:hypothetical protein
MTELESWISKAITHMDDIMNDYKKRADDSFTQKDRNINMNEYDR